MNFDKLNTAADAENGAWMHLRHPAIGHLLYEGEGADDYGRLIHSDKDHTPCRLKLRGTESPIAKEVIKKLRKQAMKDPDSQAGYDMVIGLVMDVEGITREGKSIEVNSDDLSWFFGRSEDFVVQVTDFAANKANFFTEPGTN